MRSICRASLASRPHFPGVSWSSERVELRARATTYSRHTFRALVCVGSQSVGSYDYPASEHYRR